MQKFRKRNLRLSKEPKSNTSEMATNSLGGNKIATTDGPPAETGTPPPVSSELKEAVKSAEAGESTGKRAAGHEDSHETSVATSGQVESTIRKAADVGGVGGGK
ncbi:hypothetical protein DL546_001511 [Coniochaeta pulveracea]|uniref:Uncharacterized protein n=1 Tax=Coniochaeta pulveracea TaxID=177199 RepID=A0A420XWZ3_9PEZI|nr:hypothetical protein DL546_001511 [Coniochaeta pulveracea]